LREFVERVEQSLLRVVRLLPFVDEQVVGAVGARDLSTRTV
jgi:hypothetical protein